MKSKIILIAVIVFANISFSQSYLVPLRIQDNGSASIVDTFGYHCNATYCIDGDLGDGLIETELSPQPARDIFDARFIDFREGNGACLRNGLRLNLIRPNDETSLDTFRIAFQAADSTYPLRFSWNRSEANGFIFTHLDMKDDLFGLMNVDMLSETTTTVSLPYTGLFIVAQFIFDFCPPLSIQNNETESPREFLLHQNSPNPFNPQTTIRYNVPTESYVKLIVYDMLGRPVGILVDKLQNAGEQTAKFDAGNLPSGMYLCHLQAGKFVDTKKMLLMR